MSVMLQTPSRASTASSSSFQPVSRQNTMSSHDGGRSVRQSKRYSMTTLYMSMSANEKDLEIEDDLAKGRQQSRREVGCSSANYLSSPEDPPRPQIEDLVPIKEELRVREGCQISGFKNCPLNSKSHGFGRGKRMRLDQRRYSRLTTRSKMRSRAILKMLLIYKKVSSQMTRRHKNMEICFSCYSLSLDILHISAVWSQWPRSIHSYRPSCSPFMGINTRVVKSIFC